MHLKIILLWLDINHFTSGVVIIRVPTISSHLLKVPWFCEPSRSFLQEDRRDPCIEGSRWRFPAGWRSPTVKKDCFAAVYGGSGDG
jgi:hypothetical protein